MFRVSNKMVMNWVHFYVVDIDVKLRHPLYAYELKFHRN
jgi:hypothetical protein